MCLFVFVCTAEEKEEEHLDVLHLTQAFAFRATDFKRVKRDRNNINT